MLLAVGHVDLLPAHRHLADVFPARPALAALLAAAPALPAAPAVRRAAVEHHVPHLGGRWTGGCLCLLVTSREQRFAGPSLGGVKGG